MKTCANCGTTLADQAQYCMQCGTEVGSPPAGSPQSGSADFLQPALIAGAVLGALSSIPLINLGNCICCMWAVGGGALGTWLLNRNQPGRAGTLTLGDGAFVGALSGLVGGVVATVISIPFRLLTAGATSLAEIEEMLLEIAPDIDPETLEGLMRFAEFSPLSIVMGLLFNVVAYSLFAMVGGILMVAIMGKKTTRAGASPRADM